MTRSKYHNRRTVVDGIAFDSKHEADVYCRLLLYKKSNLISGDIERQVPFELQESFEFNGKKIRPIKYIADFVFTDCDGIRHVVDAKGMKTDVYKLKKKLFEYRYRIRIEEW